MNGDDRSFHRAMMRIVDNAAHHAENRSGDKSTKNNDQQNAKTHFAVHGAFLSRKLGKLTGRNGWWSALRVGIERGI